MSRKTTFRHVSDTFWNVSFLLRSRKRQLWDQNHPISFLFSVSHGFWCRALCYPSCSIVRGMSPIVSSWNVLYHDMQFAPQEDATRHGNVSQQEDGRSIPGLVGATRHLQLPTLEEKQLLQIFCNYFAKNSELVAFFKVGWRRNIPQNSSALPPLATLGVCNLAVLPLFCLFPVENCFFPLENFNFNKTIIFGRAASGEEGGRWHWGAHLLPRELSQDEKLRKSHRRQLHPSLARTGT